MLNSISNQVYTTHTRLFTFDASDAELLVKIALFYIAFFDAEWKCNHSSELSRDLTVSEVQKS